jgi:uncharacterized protein DUF3631
MSMTNEAGEQLLNELRSAPDALLASLQPKPRPVVTPLDEVVAFCSRFIYATKAEIDTIGGWILHTYVYNLYYMTPRLIVRAKDEDSGKSTVANISKALCRDGVITGNASTPAIFKLIAMRHPTIIFDEADNSFGAAGQGQQGREKRGIFNMGAYQEGSVLRVVDNVPTEFPCFGPAMFAGIGTLPKTMMSRGFDIELHQKPASAELEDWDPSLYGEEAKRIAALVEDWITSRGPELNPWPEMPKELNNRKCQKWRSLISIADGISFEWGQRMRAASLELECGISATSRLSTGEELINTVAELTLSSQKIPTGDLIVLLRQARDEQGKCKWATWLHDPILAARQLASILRPYEIGTHQFWIDGENRRGYLAADFHLWANEDTPIATSTGREMAADDFEEEAE